MKRRTFVSLLGLLLTAALAACSISVPSPTATPTSSALETATVTAEPTGAPATPSASARSPASAGGSSSGDSSLGPVVSARSSSADGKTIELDLYRIVRDGSLAHVTFTVRSADDAVVGDLFSDRGSHDYEADGVTLIDPAAKKLYLVASHGQGRCLCTATGSLTLSGGTPTVISASFAAPPVRVTAMDVAIPHFGVFSHVPVK